MPPLPDSHYPSSHPAPNYLTCPAPPPSGEGETPYLVRFGDAGGGQYTLNMKRVMLNFGWAVTENVVQERFGSRAGRIFR